MTNPTYTRAAATAARLISAYGRTMQLVTQTNSGDSWNPTVSESTTDVYGVETKYSNSEIDGELIKSGDVKVLIDAEVKPELSMRLRTNGIDYSIINIETLAPADLTILYKLQVRR